jgi:hypothetical protein
MKKKSPAPQTVTIHQLFLDLQGELSARLRTSRRSVRHPGTKGDVTESGWTAMLSTFLPKRYSAEKGLVVDSSGRLSQQIDLIIFDRQYCPLVFHVEGATYVPAESVYAVFEVKQDLNAKHVAAAVEKARSVRALKRTSVDITSAAGNHPALPPTDILAGILTSESGWKPAFGKPFTKALSDASKDGRLDLGCCLQAGAFNVDYSGRKPTVATSVPDEALVSFFMTLLHRLQPLGTVRAIDLTAYGDFTLGKRHGEKPSPRNRDSH